MSASRLIYFDVIMWPHFTHNVANWLVVKHLQFIERMVNSNRNKYLRVVADNHTEVLGESMKRNAIGQIYAVKYDPAYGLVGHGVFFANHPKNAITIGKIRSGKYNRASLAYARQQIPKKDELTWIPVLDHLLVSDNAFFQAPPAPGSRSTEIIAKSEKSISNFANKTLSANPLSRFKLNRLVLLSLLFGESDLFNKMATSAPNTDEITPFVEAITSENVGTAEEKLSTLKEYSEKEGLDEESRQHAKSLIGAMEEKIVQVKALKSSSESNEVIKQIAMQTGYELEELVKAAEQMKATNSPAPMLQVFSLVAHKLQTKTTQLQQELENSQKQIQTLRENNDTLQFTLTRKRKHEAIFDKAMEYAQSKRQKTELADKQIEKTADEAAKKEETDKQQKQQQQVTQPTQPTKVVKSLDELYELMMQNRNK